MGKIVYQASFPLPCSNLRSAETELIKANICQTRCIQLHRRSYHLDLLKRHGIPSSLVNIRLP
jgi:hypothetical protein